LVFFMGAAVLPGEAWLGAALVAVFLLAGAGVRVGALVPGLPAAALLVAEALGAAGFVAGAAFFTGAAFVPGVFFFAGAAFVAGAVRFAGAATPAGAVLFTGAAVLAGAAFFAGAAAFFAGAVVFFGGALFLAVAPFVTVETAFFTTEAAFVAAVTALGAALAGEPFFDALEPLLVLVVAVRAAMAGPLGRGAPVPTSAIRCGEDRS
jgi:hypothetical protein